MKETSITTAGERVNEARENFITAEALVTTTRARAEEARARVKQEVARVDDFKATWQPPSHFAGSALEYYTILTDSLANANAACNAAQATLAAEIQRLSNLESSSRSISGSNQLISLHDYLRYIPPPIQYATDLPGPSSTIPPNVRHPQLIMFWQSFQEEVTQFIETEILPRTDRVPVPAFQMGNARVASKVPILQVYCLLNMFDIVATRFNCEVQSTDRGPTAGSIDGYFIRNLMTILIWEIKGCWTLNPDYFLNGRIDGPDVNVFIKNAINQLYTYMIWNHLQYGILSSGDYTFFLRRAKVKGAEDGSEVLYISSAIAHDASDPTLFQCIAFLLSISDGSKFESPPPSLLRQSPRNSLLGSKDQTFHYSAFSHQNEPMQDCEFDFEEFSFKSILGQGRTKVYYEAKNQLAVKGIDLFKQSHLLPELRNEIEMYTRLQEFQGQIIPRLVLCGFWDAAMYCIGFSLCGKVPKKLSNAQKEELLDALDAIHSKGVLHNDIQLDNILVDDTGKPFIIDFGFASIDDNYEAQEAEKNQLMDCIRSL